MVGRCRGGVGWNVFFFCLFLLGLPVSLMQLEFSGCLLLNVVDACCS